MRKSMRGKRRGGEDKSFWLCFSDLMSTLVLVLVLIMFYSLYLHFDTMEEATARLLQTEHPWQTGKRKSPRRMRNCASATCN